MTDKIKRSLDFVVKFYRPGAFRPDGWFIEKPLPWWRRHAAAAILTAVALIAAATASLLIFSPKPSTQAPAPVVAPATPAPLDTAPSATPEVMQMEFDDAPLSKVVKAIEITYGVNVTGVPVGDIRLTLSYQGTADDLVATINDLLDTNLAIQK